MKFDFGGLDSVAYYYGNASVCESYLEDGVSVTSAGKLNTTMVLGSGDIYKKSGNYIATATLYDMFNPTGILANYKFLVSSTECGNPIVEILESKLHFTDPRKLMKSKAISVVGSTQFNCGVVYGNVKQWKVFKVDDKTGKDIVEVDLCKYDL